MKKNVTVITEKQNKRQDPCTKIKTVSAGYAFNYLIPKKIARIAKKGEIRHLHMIRSIVSSSQHAIHNQKMKIQDKLQKINNVFTRKTCSPNKLIFGSIAEQDIIIKIAQLTGQTIHKNQIKINYEKKLGKYRIEIILDEKIKVTLDLYVIPKAI